MLALESIAFNHDTSSATRDALSIRLNASTALQTPEWVRGATVLPEDCPVAYAIAPTRNNVLTVKATLRRTDPSVQSVTVRTFNPNDTRLAGCLYAILTKLGAKFVMAPRPPILNAIGEVVQTVITFGANDIVTVELPLHDTQIWTSGVGVFYDTWHWEFLNAQGAWVEFQVSNHKVYVLLDVPTDPWTQLPLAAANLPWTMLLDFACSWARGQKTADGAAALITKSVFELAPATITYDCPGGGWTHYSRGTFDCTAFLDRLRGGPGLGLYVNCSDCATFVSTFANAIGCNLWQSRMGYYFDLNPILALGSSVWQTACNWGGFSYHEVAWKGPCTETEAVFDACLKVDGDADPTSAPHTPLLPANMIFGQAGSGTYRDRLATPASRVNCAPQPDTATRRTVS